MLLIGCTSTSVGDEHNQTDPNDTTTEGSEGFLEQSNVGIYSSQTPLKSYDRESDQIIYSSSLDEYMVTNYDNSIYLYLNISGELSLDSSPLVEITSSGIEQLSDTTLVMSVVKQSQTLDSLWLWSAEAEKGVIITKR